MAVIRFARKTPEDVLEEASFRERDAVIVYQDRSGRVFSNWQDYMWSQLRANAKTNRNGDGPAEDVPGSVRS